jgi:hypothetical protein
MFPGILFQMGLRNTAGALVRSCKQATTVASRYCVEYTLNTAVESAAAQDASTDYILQAPAAGLAKNYARRKPVFTGQGIMAAASRDHTAIRSSIQGSTCMMLLTALQ